MDAAGEQKTIDFNRGAFERIVRALPRTRGCCRDVLLAWFDLRRVSVAQPSLAELATATGVSRKTVKRAIDELETLGWIRTEPQTNTDGSPGPNIIHIAAKAIDAAAADSENIAGGNIEATGGRVAVTLPRRHDPTPMTLPPSGHDPTPSGGEGGATSSFTNVKHICHVHAGNGSRKEESRQEEKRRCWGRAGYLTKRDLLDERSIDQLFRYAVQRGRCVDGPRDRFRFTALCLYVAREGETPALLTNLVFGDPAGVKWTATQADEDEAERRTERALSGNANPALRAVASPLFALPPEVSQQQPDRRAELARRAQLERNRDRCP